ncbi:phage minor capsid protein [Glaciihabitans sp. dw_435]|uniref:phage minor capsid protein n=1 Tax=Glaciihabitans sp. dw_435 TaxID=2720081 RepID=UPI001BD3729D|nr:phage minor capsid protein [Glaciihabitans sp. dw_435]
MAVYVPDPENPVSAADLIEELGLELAARYAGAEDELIRSVARRAYRDLALQEALRRANLDSIDRKPFEAALARNRALAELEGYRAQTLRELQFTGLQMAEKLRSDELAQSIIDIAAKEGEAAAVARLGMAKRLPVTTPLTGNATQAVAQLTLDLSSRLEAMHLRIARYPQDAYQRVINMTASNVLLGVQTSQLAQRTAVQRFLGEGITGFVDKADRNWHIGSYAEMATRTAVNRAYNDAGVWRMQQSGINLVTVQGASDSCKRCAPWVGKILSTDGTTGAVTVQHATQDKTITVVIAATLEHAKGAGLFHPNCRHKCTAYLPGLSIPQKGQEYDPIAERERETQRAIERKIRSAKRDESVAGDDISRRRAHRDVLDGQAEMRDFVNTTGRPRASYREQLAFADG